MTNKSVVLATSLTCMSLIGCGGTHTTSSTQVQLTSSIESQKAPGSSFDLSHWYLTVPLDEDGDQVSDIYDVADLQGFSHPDFFYLDEQNNMVFATPNRAATERTSTNTRSELRYMLRGEDTSIPEGAPGNNFALAAHKNAQQFAAIGGKLEATLHVDHVATNAQYPNKPPAYSVVIGQVHAFQLDDEQQKAGFGWGNEPLKISYKKWPNHSTGSVFWTYERNLATNDPNRIDIAYPVWGSNWDDPSDPGDKGIALGEEFSYEVNIVENVMHLVFTSTEHGTVHQHINLADNIDANGNIDEADYPLAYQDETLYFKAGAYNQCSTKQNDPSFRYPGCSGTGDWKTDLANGDYTQVTFSSLKVSPATPVQGTTGALK
ncbi:Poly(beta-D-mannuronate) lyase [Paraglaciecola sp. T6c]|uniref:polysaccharide lyase family 7 protein n=1 Tax=Pseudoalteromonas atlantica (strain T6c / ATCC BAA-1087) TaxID=3042615 RepID=UPI00005C7518|nr:polysaccharide lyase family 7 protein [Paraglaciecola sp. T6c]ABG42141.1 Poly(beta-D-mannuronate) lyase [Paraglaciecola sp. T6c]